MTAFLTKDGLRAEGHGRILLLACGALAREILALKAANGWDHMDLHCLPANLQPVARPHPRCRGKTPCGKTRRITTGFLWFTPIAARAGYCRHGVTRWVSRWSQGRIAMRFF